MLNASNPEGIIAHLQGRSDAAGHAAQRAMLGFLQNRGAPAVLALAKQKSPKLFRALKDSGREKPLVDGTRITFGGLAGDYAAAIHEERGRLRGRVGRGTDRAGRYVYQGSGVGQSSRGGGAGNPGYWNTPRRWGKGTRAGVTAWANRITRSRPFYGGAQGDRLIEWSGRRWRFKKADYAKRYDAARYPKYGQPHFLFGANNSAYGEKRTWIVTQMAAVGVRAAGQAV